MGSGDWVHSPKVASRFGSWHSVLGFCHLSDEISILLPMRYPRCGKLKDWTLKKKKKNTPSNPFVVKQVASEKNRFTSKLAISREVLSADGKGFFFLH